jgi:predicted transcriptional regulator
MTQVRLDADVAERLDELSRSEDVSVAKLVNRLLRSTIDAEQPSNSLLGVQRPANARVSVASVRHRPR